MNAKGSNSRAFCQIKGKVKKYNTVDVHSLLYLIVYNNYNDISQHEIMTFLNMK